MLSELIIELANSVLFPKIFPSRPITISHFNSHSTILVPNIGTRETAGWDASEILCTFLYCINAWFPRGVFGYLMHCSVCCYIFLSLSLGSSALPVQLGKAQSNILPELNMFVTPAACLSRSPTMDGEAHQDAHKQADTSPKSRRRLSPNGHQF